MGAKQKITAAGTYVFDPEEIEQLDELSMTSVLSAVVEAIPEEHCQPEPPIVAPVSRGNTTINELLSGQLGPDDGPPARLPARSEPVETTDDLIDPDVIFPELTTSRGGKGT